MSNTSKNSKIIIYDSIAYSSKAFEYNIIKEINYEFPKEFSEDKLKTLKKLLSNPPLKTIEIYEFIQNFKEEKEKIREKINSKKAKILDEENYELIPIYSQKELLNSIILSITNTDLEKLEQLIIKYFEKYQKEYDKLKNKKEEKISIIEINLKKIRKDILQFKKKILDTLEEEIISEEKILKQLQQEKGKHEEIFYLIKEKDESTTVEREIEDKEKRLRFKIKNLSLDEKLYKAKISTLKTNLKSKKFKTIEPIPFILTLGMIYWTSFSDTKNIILKYETKINKLKEKEIHLEKKIEEILEKKRILKEENLEKLKEITKKEDILQKKIHELEKKVDKQKKSIEKKYDVRKKKEEEYSKLVENETLLTNQFIKESEEHKKLLELDEETLLKEINEIEIERETKKKELEEMLKNIEKQIIHSKKNYILEL